MSLTVWGTRTSARREGEAHAGPGLRIREPDAPTVRLHDRARNRQSQPRRSVAAPRSRGALGERLEHAIAITFGDALARVRHLDLDGPAGDRFGPDDHAAVGGRVPDRVLDQVEQ